MIDIAHNARVVTFDDFESNIVAAEDRSRALITLKLRQLTIERATEPDRMAETTLEGRHHNRGTPSQGIYDCPSRLRPNEGHIAQGNDTGVEVGDRTYTAGEACTHSRVRLHARNNDGALPGKQIRWHVCTRAYDGKYPISHVKQEAHARDHHRSTVWHLHKEFVAPKANASARRKQNAGNHGGASGSPIHATGASAWLLSETSSERMARAISAGVRLPIGSPTGPRRRATSD